MARVNGIDFAESNYTSWLWFWTWPIHRLLDFQEQADGRLYHFAIGSKINTSRSGSLFPTDNGCWGEYFRCPCGTGFSTSSMTFEFCTTCGRHAETYMIPWVGRRVANRWMWKPVDQLPRKLQLKVKSEKSNLDAGEEFERRVQAAVEVELASRQAARDASQM